MSSQNQDVWHIFIQKDHRVDIQGSPNMGYVDVKVNGKVKKRIPFQDFIQNGFNETIDGQRIRILSEAEKRAQKIERERQRRLMRKFA